jgi:hypothetical protein
MSGVRATTTTPPITPYTREAPMALSNMNDPNMTAPNLDLAAHLCGNQIKPSYPLPSSHNSTQWWMDSHPLLSPAIDNNTSHPTPASILRLLLISASMGVPTVWITWNECPIFWFDSTGTQNRPPEEHTFEVHLICVLSNKNGPAFDRSMSFGWALSLLNNKGLAHCDRPPLSSKHQSYGMLSIIHLLHHPFQFCDMSSMPNRAGQESHCQWDSSKGKQRNKDVVSTSVGR